MSFIQQTLKKHRQRVGLSYFIFGAFFGFLASSLLSLASWSHGDKTTQQQPPQQQQTRRDAIIKPSSSDKVSKEQNGWSLVHVFYGNTSHIEDASSIPQEYFQKNQWFAQLKQDLVVSTLLRQKRNGYFVDLASNDAVRISNTYALETFYGWTGLCLEPNPMYWAGLSYRKCDVVGAVVGKESMQEVHFKYPNRSGPKGGIVGKDFDNKIASKFYEDHRRFTVTLAEIFERFNTPKIIDYFSLDVEGAEDFIMGSFPFSDYQFNVLTVERPSEVLRNLLESHGYMMLKQLQTWGETLWIHRSIEATIDRAALNIDTTEKYREKTTAPPMAGQGEEDNN